MTNIHYKFLDVILSSHLQLTYLLELFNSKMNQRVDYIYGRMIHIEERNDD